MPVQNAEIAAMFDQTADLLEFKGENQFRVRAYHRAARTVEGLPQGVRSLLSAEKDLTELPGIGKDLAGKIADIVKTGHFALLDSLKKKLPGELDDMAALPGLGPKRVRLLYDKLKVRTLEDLRRAIKGGRLQKLRGFGPTMEKKLAAALEKPVVERRFKLAVAEAEAEALVAFLRDGRVIVAGSYRRRRDTVGDLDVLVTSKHGAAVGDKLVQYENVAEVLAHGPTRTTVMLRSGLQVDVRAVPEQSYGAALLYFTGSKAHNIALRGLANDRDWKLNEYELFSGKRRIAGATEEQIYDKLGLAYIPPELLSFTKKKETDPLMDYLVSFRDRMEHARVLLTDPALTTFFFVTLAEALPIAVVTRFIQWFKDFGIPVGGVLVNMVIDAKSVGPDAAEFVKNRVAMQQEHLKTIWREFDDSVRAIVPLFEAEVRGVPMLQRLCDAIFAADGAKPAPAALAGRQQEVGARP